MSSEEASISEELDLHESNEKKNESDSDKEVLEKSDSIAESDHKTEEDDESEESEVKNEEIEGDSDENNSEKEEQHEDIEEKSESHSEEEITEKSEDKESTSNPAPPSHNPPPPSYIPSAPNSKEISVHSFFRVCKNYTPNSDETEALKLKRGEIIIFLSKIDDEWYKGQLGEEVGNFRADHVEPITEEEVKKFLSKESLKSSGPSKSKEELKEEMRSLKEANEKVNEEIESLTKEIEDLKVRTAKARKELRMTLSQSMEVLPAALYHIDTIECFRNDIMKIIIDLENLLEFENGESKETITILSEQINVFLTTLSIFQQNDSKFKNESEKVQTQARMFLSGLLNEMSSYDPTNTKAMIKELETLYFVLGNKETIQKSIEMSETPKPKKKKKKDKTTKSKTSDKKTKKKSKTKKS